MKKDRFLMGILIFIGVLVVAAVVLFFVRKQAPAYGEENTPQGVLYNYVVAIQLHDYERAYGYLADQKYKPSLAEFQQFFLNESSGIDNTALQVGNVQNLQNGDALINVTIEHSGSGVFDNGWSQTDKATLTKFYFTWKITHMPYPYWGWNWYQVTPVPVK